MDAEQIREYCLSLDPEVEECFPFGPEYLVFKTSGKMFALIDLSTQWLAVKCDPEKAVGLREEYEYVTPAYHFNKKHWNGVDTPKARGEQIREWVKDSFGLVGKKKKKQNR